MRIRTVKPEFYQSETMAQVSREVRDLAKALISWSDDEGYFKSAPQLIAGSLYPFDSDGQEFVRSGLISLERIGYLQLFEGGVGFLPGFASNQRINRATHSILKPKAGARLQFSEPSVSPHGALSEPSRQEGKGREMEGKGVEGISVEQARPDAVRQVFEHWQSVMSKPKAILDDKRRRAVQARLAEGRTVEELKQAVNGCFVTPHNMGVNDRGEKFNDLELICRNGPNVERFINNSTAPPVLLAKPRLAPTDPNQEFPTGELHASPV